MTLHPRHLLPLVSLLAACAAGRAGPGAPPWSALPAVSREAAEAEARALDLAFSGASVAHDPQAFASFLAPDTIFVSGGGVAPGVAAVLNDWAPLFRPGGPTLAWAPDTSLASGGGDLVLTRGGWTLTGPDGGQARTGRYLTVWQREPDGRLRVVLDATDTPLPPGSAGATRQVLRQVLSADGQLGATAGLLLDGTSEVGGFLLVEVREHGAWRVLIEVGAWRPDDA
jgi:ketosteroid isomerase-like protein